jgi:hypothetical protein
MDRETQFLEACQKGNIECIQHLMSHHGVDPNCKKMVSNINI